MPLGGMRHTGSPDLIDLKLESNCAGRWNDAEGHGKPAGRPYFPLTLGAPKFSRLPIPHTKALGHHKFTHCMEQFHNPVTFQQ
jgi:hypothetical protein